MLSLKRTWPHYRIRLASGLTLHLLIAFGLFYLKSPAKPQHLPVKIYLKTPLQTPQSELKKPLAHTSQKPGLRGQRRPAAHSKSKIPFSSSSYAQLLPKAGELAWPSSPSLNAAGESMAQHHFAAGTTGQQKQEFLRDGGTIAALFDVPMVVRQQALSRRAYAGLRRQPSSQNLWIEHLGGDPLLRAVIYEALQRPETQAILQRILPQLEGQRLKIVIQTIKTPSSQSELESSFYWEGGRLLLIKSPPQGRAGGGLGLPDHAAAVAKAWDRSHLEKLHASAAYIATIRGRKL